MGLAQVEGAFEALFVVFVESRPETVEKIVFEFSAIEEFPG